MNPLVAFELLFFAVFGQTTYEEMMVRPLSNQQPYRPAWTENLFKVVFGIYMLVSVVVLINLLIAMMSDTYQRIQVCPKPLYFNLFHFSVAKNPIRAFELLFFAVFGQTSTDQLKISDYKIRGNNNQPKWTEVLFKFLFGIYMLVSVVVLINLLIAMMTDTYQRIQVKFILSQTHKYQMDIQFDTIIRGHLFFHCEFICMVNI